MFNWFGKKQSEEKKEIPQETSQQTTNHQYVELTGQNVILTDVLKSEYKEWVGDNGVLYTNEDGKLYSTRYLNSLFEEDLDLIKKGENYYETEGKKLWRIDDYNFFDEEGFLFTKMRDQRGNSGLATQNKLPSKENSKLENEAYEAACAESFRREKSNIKVLDLINKRYPFLND